MGNSIHQNRRPLIFPVDAAAYPDPDPQIRDLLLGCETQQDFLTFWSVLFSCVNQKLPALKKLMAETYSTLSLPAAWKHYLHKNRAKLYQEVCDVCCPIPPQLELTALERCSG